MLLIVKIEEQKTLDKIEGVRAIVLDLGLVACFANCPIIHTK